jgi:uncharacterized protein YjbI with pentapeptide repeats
MRATPSQLRLHYVDLTDVAMPGANLVGAVLTRIRLAEAHLEAVDFSDARLTEVDLTGVRADRATFYDAVLTNCVLARTGLSGTDLAAASLHGCRLAGADLTGAALTAPSDPPLILPGARVILGRRLQSLVGGRRADLETTGALRHSGKSSILKSRHAVRHGADRIETCRGVGDGTAAR